MKSVTIKQRTLALIFAMVGLLIVAVAIPMIIEAVPRNGFYGFRTSKTLASDEVWYPANKYAGKWLLAVGAITAMGSFLLWTFARNMAINRVVSIALALLLIPLAVAVYFSFNYLSGL